MEPLRQLLSDQLMIGGIQRLFEEEAHGAVIKNQDIIDGGRLGVVEAATCTWEAKLSSSRGSL